jgi:hypothetical protein
VEEGQNPSRLYHRPFFRGPTATEHLGQGVQVGRKGIDQSLYTVANMGKYQATMWRESNISPAKATEAPRTMLVDRS